MTLRNQAPLEEIDYPYLCSLLREYKHPRNKINSLINKGVITRVKKGLYVFGKEYSLGPYSKESLANLIYGPSAISLEYALSFHGLIPERVEEITSITPNRNKRFKTPVGYFSYRYLNNSRYSPGISLYQQDKRHNILMARPEKALIDKLFFSSPLEDSEDLISYLFEDLRIEEQDLFQLDLKLIENLVSVYRSPNANLLAAFMRRKG